MNAYFRQCFCLKSTSISTVCTHIHVYVHILYQYTPQPNAAAPINTGGIAIIKHPNAATNDRICAPVDVLQDRTLWK